MPADEPLKADESFVHVWYRCHNCQAAPIVGERYHCTTCPAGPANDLCKQCHDLLRERKIRHPANENAGDFARKDHRFTAHKGRPARIYEPWLQVRHLSIPTPRIPHPFVVRPIFYSGHDFALAGYAFAVRDADHPPVVVTALHVLDEIIKKLGIDSTDGNASYTGKELPAAITNVDIFDVFAANWMLAPLGSVGPMLMLPGARTEDEEPNSDRDIAAFRLKDPKALQPALLAPKPPLRGDPIWLVARSQNVHGTRMFKATVVEISDKSMIFKFEKPVRHPVNVSGAPLVDKSSKVVGIMVGGGEFKGEKVGHANHVENIRRHLNGMTI